MFDAFDRKAVLYALGDLLFLASPQGVVMLCLRFVYHGSILPFWSYLWQGVQPLQVPEVKGGSRPVAA